MAISRRRQVTISPLWTLNIMPSQYPPWSLKMNYLLFIFLSPLNLCFWCPYYWFRPHELFSLITTILGWVSDGASVYGGVKGHGCIKPKVQNPLSLSVLGGFDCRFVGLKCILLSGSAQCLPNVWKWGLDVLSGSHIKIIISAWSEITKI